MPGHQRRPQRPKRAEQQPVLAPAEESLLIVLLGLPGAVMGDVRGWIKEIAQRPVRVMPLAASPDDNRPYSQQQVEQHLTTVAEFARRKQRAEQQPAPSGILLLYVPGKNADRMLASFSFFSFPIALTALAHFEEGRQQRHDRNAVRAAIAAALSPGSAPVEQFARVKARIESPSDNEPLLLPPANFHVAADQPLAAHFRLLAANQADFDRTWLELDLGEYDKRRLPHLRPGVTRRAYRDARHLVFLCADGLALDGRNRTAAMDAEVDALAHVLRGAYRFGAALPRGFHHDTQLEEDKNLGGITFACAERGPVHVGDTYANIYPNDRVRGKNIRPHAK